jgi:hypothetical protein
MEKVTVGGYAHKGELLEQVRQALKQEEVLVTV